MGNLFSKRNRVKPISVKRDKCPTIPLRKRLFSINNRVAAIQNANTITENASVDRNASSSMRMQASEAVFVEDSTPNAAVQLDFTMPRSQLFSAKKPELPGEKRPLPDIGQQVEKCIVRRKVKRNTYGQTTSVAFDVNFVEENNLNPEKEASRMPRRLRRLPDITQELVQARLAEAVNRDRNVIDCGSQNTRAPQILSTAMLNRLQEEKQREMKLHSEEKQRKAARRKELLKNKKAEKIRLANEKQKIVKENFVQQEREASISIEWKILNKIRTADQRKAEMKQRAQEKREMLRLRRLRAQLKSRGNTEEYTNVLRDKVEDEFLRGRDDECTITSFSRRIHLNNMKALGDKRRDFAGTEVLPINVPDISPGSIPQDAQKREKGVFHDDIDDDAFWDIT